MTINSWFINLMHKKNNKVTNSKINIEDKLAEQPLNDTEINNLFIDLVKNENTTDYRRKKLFSQNDQTLYKYFSYEFSIPEHSGPIQINFAPIKDNKTAIYFYEWMRLQLDSVCLDEDASELYETKEIYTMRSPLPVDLNISSIQTILATEAGLVGVSDKVLPPSYLIDKNNWIVFPTSAPYEKNRPAESPLIAIEYSAGTYFLIDGNHRLGNTKFVKSGPKTIKVLSFEFLKHHKQDIFPTESDFKCLALTIANERALDIMDTLKHNYSTKFDLDEDSTLVEKIKNIYLEYVN